jgi:hypothetical protein
MKSSQWIAITYPARPALVRAAVVLLVAIACQTATAVPIYKGIDLYIADSSDPAAGTGQIDFPPRGFASPLRWDHVAAGGQVVGMFEPDTPNSGFRAVAWNPPTGSLTDLNGSFVGTRVEATDGIQQVGWANGGNTAVLWSGTAASAVQLGPGVALALGGGQQVGCTSPNLSSLDHALLWAGSAASKVDLHPAQFAGITGSIAYGTDGTQQVGGGFFNNFVTIEHAVLWSGTAASAIDLHPSQFTRSEAIGVRGGDQVGVGFLGSARHALLWSGTAASAVDLNPLNGFSTAEDTNGSIQVGWGGFVGTGHNTALLWSGTAQSAVDLGALLPLLPAGLTWTDSYAFSVDVQGDIFGTAFTYDGTAEVGHAVEWIPVPEPATFVLLALGAGILLARPRRLWYGHVKAISPAATLLAIALTAHSARAAPIYKGIDLYPLMAPSGFSSAGPPSPFPQVASAGRVVGDGTYIATGLHHAFLWSSPSGAAVDLSPTNLSGFDTSSALGTDGVQEVGSAGSSALNIGHAVLWNGTPSSAVDLNPTNLSGSWNSVALGVAVNQQVGAGTVSGNSGRAHALLWSGTANSAIDLHPTNPVYIQSRAFATDGAHQVGDANYGADSGSTHAMLWSGTANSVVDLEPTNLSGFGPTIAYGVGGAKEVGYGTAGNGLDHALLWSGTASSAIDLNPTGLGDLDVSYAYATDGTHQVGWGYPHLNSALQRALVWSGTATSAIDLQQFLPTALTYSRAFSIDAQGDIFGTALDSSFQTRAVEWIPVPEPAAWVLFALGAAVVTASWAGGLPVQIHRCGCRGCPRARRAQRPRGPVSKN